MIIDLSSILGARLAKDVVSTLVSKGASAAIKKLGAKIGSFAGPVGFVIGWIAGAL